MHLTSSSLFSRGQHEYALHLLSSHVSLQKVSQVQLASENIHSLLGFVHTVVGASIFQSLPCSPLSHNRKCFCNWKQDITNFSKFVHIFSITDFNMVAVHISKQSLSRLKITVDCPSFTCRSIHFSLDEDTLKITVGCLVCGVWCVVVVCCGGVLWWCVVVVCGGGVWWWCVVVVCGGAWHTLSHVLSPSSSLSLAFSLLSFFFSFIFLFLFLLLLILLLLLLLFFLFLFFLFFPSTHSSLLFPSRQQTMYKALINKQGVQL